MICKTREITRVKYFHDLSILGALCNMYGVPTDVLQIENIFLPMQALRHPLVGDSDLAGSPSADCSRAHYDLLSDCQSHNALR